MKTMPKSVLFVCSRNAVRSPMAAALLQKWAGNQMYVDSAGLDEEGTVDGFAVAVMQELAIDISQHEVKHLDTAGHKNFDLIIALSADAHYRALLLAKESGAVVEHWTIPNPTETFGPRDMKIQAYRSVRSLLATKIRQRFTDLGKTS